MNTDDPKGKNGGDKLIYRELSYTLTGACFDVHNKLGRFSREKQYSDLLEQKLKELEVSYKREYRVGSTGNTVDFLADEKIVIEVKAKKLISKEDFYQTQRYLQILKLPLALLVNFNNRYLKPIRVIRIDTDVRKKFL